jgi:Fe-S-cluster containining protein
MPTNNSRVRPLIARPGARFKCFGDGLCCTDIHLLGPLTRAEANQVRARSREAVVLDGDDDEYALRPVEGGGCYFLSKSGCRIHTAAGIEAKPTGCRRFPFVLVATPHGGRVTTEHRCPCRTMGNRPPLDLTEADASLREGGGRLRVDDRMGNRVRLTRKRSISFDRYAEIEAGLLQGLSRGRDPRKILKAEPLPELDTSSWPVQAAEFIDMHDDTAGGTAVAWFGDALLNLCAGHKPPRRDRPWAPAFERARARCRKPVSPAAIFNDWLADEIWMFRGLTLAPFDVARAELVTRYAVARQVQKRIAARGVRADQAAAEAVMVVEVTTGSSDWNETIAYMARTPGPAGEIA